MDDDGSHYAPPLGAVGTLDLRNIPQQSDMKGEGYGFFALDRAASLPAGSTLFGYDLNSAPLPGSVADAIVKLNLRPGDLDPAAPLLFDGVLILTSLADPTGQNRVKPVMPTDGKLVILLGGHSPIWQEPFQYGPHPHTAQVRAVHQHDYAEFKKEKARGRDPDQHKRVLDWLAKHYGADYREFLGKEPDLGRLPHKTTLSDDFTRADADAMGSSSEGWSWTEVLSDIDIVSNAAKNGASAAASARAESDLSSANHYCQATCTIVTSTNAYVRVAVRFAAAADTMYVGGHRDNATDEYEISKVVAGAVTQLFVAGTGTGDGPFVDKLTASGSALTLDVDGVQKISNTDTSITTGTRCGIRTGNPGGANRAVWDNWSAADLGPTAAQIMAAMADPVMPDFGVARSGY